VSAWPIVADSVPGMPVVSLPDTEWIEMVGPVAGVEAVPWDITSEPPRRDEIEVVVPPYIGSREPLARLAALPSLRAVQLLTAGYDDVLPLVPPGVVLANAGGVHDASTAELAVGLMLATLRGFPQMVRGQDQSRWVPVGGRPALADKRVLVLGYGSIGRAVARRLTGFEVSLTAVASRARDGDDLVDRVHGIEELHDLLPHSDVVVVIVPLSEATTGLVDPEFLAAMPDGALLVNVARGKVVDTDALVEATATGRIMAALDVTDPEPLPDGHPLWRCPGVFITPHVGGDTSAFTPRAVRLVRQQLTAFVAGEPLRNVVNGG
jgi:phosphoglycerate dehydrogenase-like enzyme